MRTKKKTFKVKNKEKDEFIQQKRYFLWRLINDNEINAKKSRLTFQRGGDEVTTKKGLKKVKKYEKWYRQLIKKRAPVAAIIQTLILIAPVVCYFVFKEPIIQVAMIIVASIVGAITLFVWIAYMITMIRKKKIKKWLIDESGKFDKNPQTVVQNLIEEEPIEVVEPYMQGEEK